MTDMPMALRKKIPVAFQKIRDTPHDREDLDYPIHRYLQENNVAVDPTGSDVIDFLRGKSILITGATGFLGMLLVEKLLRSCPDIAEIYVIVREKKGKNIDERIQEYLGHEIFIPLSRIFLRYKEKVIGIEGDLQLEGLGLSDQSRHILNDKVNIIFHIAATVRFNEKIKVATNINVRGTKEILALAKQCKDLVSFVHMSTAYSNCNYKTIDEKFYEPVISPDGLIQLTNIFDEEVLDQITPKLLGDLPNTYTLTKQIAEDIIRIGGVGLPICIHRPSIVYPTVKEPVGAWSNNIYGPVGILIGGGLGVLHVMKGDTEKLADLVPADYVINSCIVSSYKTALDRNRTSVPIYNYVSTPQSPLKWADVGKHSSKYGIRVGTALAIYHAWGFPTKSEFIFRSSHFLFHRVPAFIFDSVAKLKGQKPQMMKVYDKYEKFMGVLENFTMNQWNFKNDNTQILWSTMNDKDKAIFPFDLTNFDWEDYFVIFFLGVREFIVRDYLDTLEYSRIRYKRLMYLHYFLTASICFMIFWIVKVFVSAVY